MMMADGGWLVTVDNYTADLVERKGVEKGKVIFAVCRVPQLRRAISRSRNFDY